VLEVPKFIRILQQEQVARTFRAEGLAEKSLRRALMCDSAKDVFAAAAVSRELQPAYCLKTNGGPLTRFPLRLTVTSTRSAILTKGMPLFIP